MSLQQWKTPAISDAELQFRDLMMRITGLTTAAEGMNHVCAQLVDEVDRLEGRVSNLEKTLMNLLKCLKDAT